MIQSVLFIKSTCAHAQLSPNSFTLLRLSIKTGSNEFVNISNHSAVDIDKARQRQDKTKTRQRQDKTKLCIQSIQNI